MGTQVGKSSKGQYARGLGTSKVVPGGVQLGGLDQLQGQQAGELALHLVPPNPVFLLNFCADLFYVSPNAITPSCECPEIRDCLRILVPSTGLEQRRCSGRLWNEEGENGPTNG